MIFIHKYRGSGYFHFQKKKNSSQFSFLLFHSFLFLFSSIFSSPFPPLHFNIFLLISLTSPCHFSPLTFRIFTAKAQQ